MLTFPYLTDPTLGKLEYDFMCVLLNWIFQKSRLIQSYFYNWWQWQKWLHSCCKRLKHSTIFPAIFFGYGFVSIFILIYLFVCFFFRTMELVSIKNNSFLSFHNSYDILNLLVHHSFVFFLIPLDDPLFGVVGFGGGFFLCVYILYYMCELRNYIFFPFW